MHGCWKHGCHFFTVLTLLVSLERVQTHKFTNIISNTNNMQMDTRPSQAWVIPQLSNAILADLHASLPKKRQSFSESSLLWEARLPA